MAERIIYQSDGVADDPYSVGGEFTEWQNNLARYSVGNSRLVFALSAAFAGPLLDIIGAESGGFHFRGGSSIGKTTALQVAGSVWGGPDYARTWRATSNGLESVASMHCDTLLLLDEISQCESREVGQVAYMLANGQGKSRAGRRGEARRAARWRTLFLSTGEIGLADKIAEDGRGRRAAAGQEVRIVDIPADAGSGMGIFENLHTFLTADAFARHLKFAAGEHYGHASHAYLERLANGQDEVIKYLANFQKWFVETYCPRNTDGQVSRVVARFALVAAGGEIAAAYSVVPWENGEATKAAVRCFQDWLNARGGTQPAEEREAISAVRKFIELHGNSRFEPMGQLIDNNVTGTPDETRIFNRAGFRRYNTEGGIEYIVLPQVWRTEICAGLDAKLVAKTLAEQGMLKRGSEGKPQNFQRLPGFQNPVRCYVITSNILGGEVQNCVRSLFGTRQ